MTSVWEDSYWYLAPFVWCRNRYARHTGGFLLSFDNLPQTNQEELISRSSESEDKGLLVLPPDGWSAMLGCFSCGLVDTYVADDVDDTIVEKQSEGRYHSDGVCICVEARCAEGVSTLLCKRPGFVFGDGCDFRKGLRFMTPPAPGPASVPARES